MTDFTVSRHGTDSSGRGIFATQYMWDWFQGVRDRVPFGEKVVITQGAFMTRAGGGAAGSAGYHDLGGCFDLRVWNLEDDEIGRLVRELRRSGAAAWLRNVEHGGFTDPHIHFVLGSDMPLTPGARFQWNEYLAGRNGLASRGKDYHWRPEPLVTVPPKPKPVKFTLATANLNFGRPEEKQQKIIDGIDADVVFTQEDVRSAIHGRERVILRKSGREKVKLLGSGSVLASKSTLGFKIRRRELPFKDVEFPTGEEVRLVDMHDAPRRFSPLRPIYHLRFRKLVKKRLFIGGGDWNEQLRKDPAELQKRRKATWFGRKKRIDGFVVHPKLVKYVKRVRQSEPRRDGHPTVYLDMEF